MTSKRLFERANASEGNLQFCPLLNTSGDQDPNVPASQSREIDNALRRLNREVAWVRYADGGHRPPNRVSEAIDFVNRIVCWYDKHLKAETRSPTTP